MHNTYPLKKYQTMLNYYDERLDYTLTLTHTYTHTCSCFFATDTYKKTSLYGVGASSEFCLARYVTSALITAPVLTAAGISRVWGVHKGGFEIRREGGDGATYGTDKRGQKGYVGDTTKERHPFPPV